MNLCNSQYTFKYVLDTYFLVKMSLSSYDLRTRLKILNFSFRLSSHNLCKHRTSFNFYFKVSNFFHISYIFIDPPI